MISTEEMADALLEVGVFLLNRARRLDLANQLEAEGISPADVRALHAYLNECCSDEVGKPQRVLAAHLQDSVNRKQIVEDLRKRNLKVVSKPGNDRGSQIRAQDMERVRKFELDWDRYCLDKAAGLIDTVETRAMPWER